LEIRVYDRETDNLWRLRCPNGGWYYTIRW
jgi:hypothetical protein